MYFLEIPTNSKTASNASFAHDWAMTSSRRISSATTYGLHAQHEEDPNCQLSTYPEYFAQEVISKAKKKPQLAVTKEGIDTIQAYMNAMPRWTLKGHAPEKIK